MAAFEIVALDEATPQLRAPGSADTYSAPRAMAITPASLTGSAASSILSMAQTWNTTGAPKALSINVTDTASAAGSLLMDLQVGGVSRFNVDKTGAVVISDGTSALTIDSTNGATTFLQTAAMILQTSNSMILRHGNNDALFIRPATTGRGRLVFVDNTNGSPAYIYSDAANTLDQRNGVNAQAFRVYNTFTDASNYERAKITWASNVLQIGTEKAGTGTVRALEFQTDGATRLTIGTTGTVSIGTFALSQNGATFGDWNGAFGYTSGSAYAHDGNRNLILLLSPSGQQIVKIGGATASFPALKRSTTSLQARLADDSAFTNIQGKLTTDTAYTAGSIAPTGYLTLYDSTGTAYRVPCVV